MVLPEYPIVDRRGVPWGSARHHTGGKYLHDLDSVTEAAAGAGAQPSEAEARSPEAEVIEMTSTVAAAVGE